MVSLEHSCRIASDRAEESEAQRHLHTDVVDSLVNSGGLRFWVPIEYGGPALTISSGLAHLVDVSKADGAAGWCAMIANCTALAAYRIRPDWAEKIYADPAVCTGGFGMPAGTATIVDGGLEVTGTWAWGSGIDHCTWVGGGVMVVDSEGQPATTTDGSASPFVFFDPDDIELLDTWHVSGLKGTGSTDYSVKKAFVPEGRWAQFLGGEPYVQGPATRFSFFGALACGVAAVTIGLGERAIDELVQVGSKKPAGSGKSLSERTAVQAELAMAQASIRQAKTYLLSVADHAWDVAAAGSDLPDDLRVELRLAATAAVKRAVETVDLCYHASGGAAVYSSSPIQRVFRDVHVASQHAMVAARTFEPLGRHSFGLPTSLATL